MDIVKMKRDKISQGQEFRVKAFLLEKGLIQDINMDMRITNDDNGSYVELSKIILEFVRRDSNVPFMDLLGKVKQFNNAFGIEMVDTPHIPVIHEQAVRFNLLYEEMTETMDGGRNGDMVEVLDGIVDQMYILIGTIIKYGMSDLFIKSFNIVHDANMTKLDNNGKAIYRESDGKVLKGPNFKEPQPILAKLLNL